MQALTVAIGPTGVQYFTEKLVQATLVNALSTIKPADNRIKVPDFGIKGTGWSKTLSNIWINLSNGSVSNLKPGLQGSPQQLANGQFQLVLVASNFSANYSWHETYHDYHCEHLYNGIWACKHSDESGNFSYSPGIGSLITTVTLGFVYDPQTQSYDVNVVGSNGQSANTSANVPGGSIIQNEDPGCFSSSVSDATANSVDAIDFKTPISKSLPPLLRSIPASGQLTQDIKYEFALGDSGLTFPNDKGIAIGITGKVSYKGSYYPGTPPAPLPVPPPPTDTHHLQVYVSDYEMNALHWAYFQAGLLNTTVQPSDLPDPDVLKVKTYVGMIPAFKPFQAFAMQAQVNPKQPPVMAFQKVYEFTTGVMNQLQQQLPANVYQELSGLSGNAYVAVADLEGDLSGAGVPQSYYATIEKAASGMGMVVTQDIEFVLTIQNGAASPPNLVFDVARTDILTGLALGVNGSGAQTLQYAFMPVKYAATFVSTTVPKFDRPDFGDAVWPVAGEPRYDETLAAMGKTGVPLPIMQGFRFLFEQAQLSIQQGYVSVLAQVEFKGT